MFGQPVSLVATVQQRSPKSSRPQAGNYKIPKPRALINASTRSPAFRSWRWWPKLAALVIAEIQACGEQAQYNHSILSFESSCRLLSRREDRACLSRAAVASRTSNHHEKEFHFRIWPLQSTYFPSFQPLFSGCFAGDAQFRRDDRL